MGAQSKTMMYIVLSIFMIHTAAAAATVAAVDAGPDCRINDFQSYTAFIKDCDLVKTLTFNVIKWEPIPQDLVNQTRSITTIDVNNRSLEIIDEIGFCAWPKLTTLNAGRNNILALPSDLLANCRTLNSLLLSKNSISQIDENAFRNLPFLTELDLSSNQIESLDDNVFISLISLKTLRLNNNKIQAISNENFDITVKLETLDLSYNSIQTIEEGSFWNLRKLVTLDMSHNPDLSTLDLTRMDRLQYVNIDSASLEQLNIPDSVVTIGANFNKITKLFIEPNGILEELYLRNNSLANLKNLSIADQLTALDISYNNIRDVDFTPLWTTQIQRLVILGNPIRKFNVSTLIELPLLQTVEISTDSLDKETLTALEDGTTLLYNSVRRSNKIPERRNVVDITESTYAPSTESSNENTTETPTETPSTTEATNDKTKAGKNMITVKTTSIATISTSFKPATENDIKPDLLSLNHGVKLLERIHQLESKLESLSERHSLTERNVSDVRFLVVFTMITFSLFISLQIGLFVYQNYKKWNIPINISIPNVIAASQNENSNNRRRQTSVDTTMDPIIEDVF
ncbi:chaoptin-like [Sitodiplosis mosellana]|uniref:chaoptin-like n=1 Tax=Sitodiplosis mosellana TaxID=263140 RepID=UPI002443746A|nr:chaoptin-like [Sitodiplosis mosellana]